MWITEYTRYRVNGCGHDEAVQKVFRIIDGSGDQPVCTRVGRSISPPSSTGRAASSTSRSTVAFSGLNSSSNRGPIVSYQWRCSNTQTTDCSASFATPQFQYLKSGPLGTTVDPYRHADGARLRR